MAIEQAETPHHFALDTIAQYILVLIRQNATMLVLGEVIVLTMDVKLAIAWVIQRAMVTAVDIAPDICGR